MALDDDIRRISAVPLFSFLDPEARKLLAFSAELRLIESGEVLFRKGERSDAGFLIVSGAISCDDPEPGLSIRTVGVGVLIGELALMAETRRPFTATALGPTGVLRIPRALFTRILLEYPDSAVRAARFVRENLGSLVSDLRDYGASLLEET